jgi:hypothetical protein
VNHEVLLRPVVAEMRAEARRLVRLGVAVEALLLAGLVLVGVTEPWLLAWAAIPWGRQRHRRP